jgi:serine-type D-Ala-D-Ala carboxypeptidase (penicillin-binding protein 5/6)
MPARRAQNFGAVDFASPLRHSSGMRFVFSSFVQALALCRAWLFAAIALLSQMVAPVSAQVDFESAAEQALLIEYSSGAVLYQKNADQPIIPASMTKLMTVELLFEEIKNGRLQLTDQMTASENAWRTGGAPAGGSAMMLVPGARPTVEDLIRGLVVDSGNDAAITVAEGISGSEALFAARMTERGKQLGLKDSIFHNSTGFDAPGQHSTLRDLAKLAETLIRDHAALYHYFSEAEFTWNKTKQANRNGLLAVPGLGADGLKTGYLEASGYGIVGSAVQNGRRLIVAVHGLKSLRDRTQEAVKLLEWGFRSFEERTLFEPGAEIAQVEVHGGTQARLMVASKDQIRLLLPRGDLRDVSIEVRYKGPVPAPITKGSEIGRLVVLRGNLELSSAPVIAAEDVPLGSLSARAFDTLWALTVDGIRSVFSRTGAK